MTKSFLKSVCLVASVALSAPLVLAGCSEETPQQSSEQSGTLFAELTTIGSDGANYGFPSDAYLVINSGTWSEFYWLGGSETQLIKTLPVGNYTASLFYQNGNTVLTKTEGASTSVVSAEWIDPQPVTFDVLPDQTTALVLHFQVESLVDLTFATGTLQVQFDVVEEAVADANLLTEGGTVSFYQQIYADPAAAYVSELELDLTSDYYQGLWIQSTTNWAFAGAGVLCKQGTIYGIGYTVDPGVQHRMEQVAGPTAQGQVCVYETGATDWVYFSAWKYGAAPPSQQSFLPGTNYTFSVSANGYVGDVFDGTTFQQSELAELTAVQFGSFNHYIYDGDTNVYVSEVWADFTGDIQFMP